MDEIEKILHEEEAKATARKNRQDRRLLGLPPDIKLRNISISVSLPRGALEIIRAYSLVNRITVSALVRKALEAHLKMEFPAPKRRRWYSPKRDISEHLRSLIIRGIDATPKLKL